MYDINDNEDAIPKLREQILQWLSNNEVVEINKHDAGIVGILLYLIDKIDNHEVRLGLSERVMKAARDTYYSYRL